jgi:hypothetical protein
MFSPRAVFLLALLPATASAMSFGVEPLCLAPTITSVAVDVPAGDELMSRGDIHYVDGDILEVTIRTSACAEIAGVRLSDLSLATFYDPIEGGDAWYEVIPTPVDGFSQDLTVRVHASNLGQGLSRTVDIDVHDPEAPASVSTHSFVLAQVAEIGGLLPIIVTEAEFNDPYISNIFADFGNQGRWTPEGVDYTLYDPDYDDMEMRPEADGIHLRFESEVETWWCDPTMVLSGRFHVELDIGGFFVVWDEPVSGTLDCWVPDWLANDAESIFEARVTEQMLEALPDCGDVNCLVLFESVEHLDGGLAFYLQELVPETVQIDLPYDADRIEGVRNYGLAVAAGETIGLSAGGTAEVCRAESDPTTCVTRTVGPGGTFNWETDAPVPDPWVLATDMFVHYPERSEARAELIGGMYRDTEALDAPDLAPGRMLARGDTMGVFLLDKPTWALSAEPCHVDAPGTTGNAQLAFGPNDYEYGGSDFSSDSLRLRVSFASDPTREAMIEAFGPCTSVATEIDFPDDILMAL